MPDFDLAQGLGRMWGGEEFGVLGRRAHCFLPGSGAALCDWGDSALRWAEQWRACLDGKLGTRAMARVTWLA
ncbi:hypothetical protein NBRC116601_15280 [Cognatishimia sp. WU-CL00825]